MKFNKEQKISLRNPKAKTAEHFIPPPDNVGGFALVKEPWNYRRKNFMPSDLVRISYNQRYATERGYVQVISIAEEISSEKRFMGNHYLIPKNALRNIKEIPPNTIVRVMSKEYLPPVGSKLSVKSHKKGIVTVEYEGQPILISDQHIEGVPSAESDSYRWNLSGAVDYPGIQYDEDQPHYEIAPDYLSPINPDWEPR